MGGRLHLGWLRQPKLAHRCRSGGRLSHQGSIKRAGSPVGNLTGGAVTYSNSLEKIETIRDDGLIEGADPTIAALTGRIDVRFADTTLIDFAAGGTPVDLEFAYTLSAMAKLVLTAHEVYLPKPSSRSRARAACRRASTFAAPRTPPPGACSPLPSRMTSMGPSTCEPADQGVVALRVLCHEPAMTRSFPCKSSGPGWTGSMRRRVELEAHAGDPRALDVLNDELDLIESHLGAHPRPSLEMILDEVGEGLRHLLPGHREAVEVGDPADRQVAGEHELAEGVSSLGLDMASAVRRNHHEASPSSVHRAGLASGAWFSYGGALLLSLNYACEITEL
jgi:hypothetical protein